jgi:hypothetical protein
MEVMMVHKNYSSNTPDKLLLKKANLSTNSEQGYLKIRVSTGLGKLPLRGAKVTVYVSLDELVPIQTVTSDENGNCPIITLPVYYNPEIKEMDPIYFYTDYNFSVSFNNYYPVATYSVQVFPGITTEFDVNMNPVPAIDPFINREQQIVIPRINL